MSIRWQDLATALLGFWLAVSPLQMGYTLDHLASGNACGLGVVFILFNLMAAGRIVDEGQEFVNILLGIWLVLSPYALDFAAEKKPAINAIAVGIAIIVLAAWQVRDATAARKK